MALATRQTADTVVARTGPRKRKRWTRYSNRTFYFFVSPWVLGFVGLTVIPFAYALLVSFTSFDGISLWRWVGLKNYLDIFRDGDAFYSLGRSLLFTVVAVPLQVFGGLGLALLLDRKMHGIGIFRTIFYLPAVVPIVAAAITWRSVFSRDTGILNAFIEHLGGPTITWLQDPTAFYALLIMTLWGIGAGMVISLAGLQGVPEELKEAARVDGANFWHILRRIILPILSPILFFQIVLGFINTIQTLVQPLLLSETSGVSQGGWNIPHGNYLYMIHVYEQFLFYQRFGYGSALLWILFAIILGITLLVFRTSTFWVYYEVEQKRRKGKK
jgi:multiple sugar transport system permease protein